jgi:hypothetical protein
MRILVSAILLILTVTPPFKQSSIEIKCKLQELAIDAALGDPEAQHNLGVEFHRGDNIPRDYTNAATMWRQSSAAGVIESYNNLGHLIYHGRGVKQDYAEGVRLWRIAAEKGFAESQVHIGQAYSDGKYLKRDYIEAYAWAKAGKHFAAQMEDNELGKAVEELADEHLSTVSSKLTETDKKAAERRAAEYIVKYRPKAR